MAPYFTSVDSSQTHAFFSACRAFFPADVRITFCSAAAIRVVLAKPSAAPYPRDRSFAISRLGGAPNIRLYSRLNCDGLS